MELLTENDLDLRELTGEELADARDPRSDVAHHMSDHDPPRIHGVLVRADAIGMPADPLRFGSAASARRQMLGSV